MCSEKDDRVVRTRFTNRKGGFCAIRLLNAGTKTAEERGKPVAPPENLAKKVMEMFGEE